MRIGTRLAGLSVILGVIVACGGEDGKKGDAGADGVPGADGENGQTALVNVVSGEPEDCEHGGVVVEFGLDADGDEKLDAGEISGTKAICHGAEGEDGEDGTDGEEGPSGHSALADVRTEPAGEHCEFGGQRLDLGTDLDDSGTLDEGEITSTSYVCNGEDGEDGEDGAPGAEGEQGPSGADGHDHLFLTSDEDPGANCVAGGKRIDSGTDDDDDGVLDAAEIDATDYVCHGENGTDGHNALVAVSDEAAGANCTAGGKRIDSGTDDDDSNSLDALEIDATEYVCNGEDGADGQSSLVLVSDEGAGANCSSGGHRIESGIDDDGSGTLEPGEVDASEYVCNGDDGDDGHDSLVVVVDEPAGANCTAGGKLVTTGIDDDGNGVLDAPEVDDTDYVCHGASGTNGTNALVATAVEATGSNCAAGGTKITFGQDDNGNGVLDVAEVDGTSYVCNGTAGFVPAFSGQIGPSFLGWTQCEGYRDAAGIEDVPAAWGNDCVAAQYTKVKLVCGASIGAYRYIDVNKNPFRDGLVSYPENGLITASKDQTGANFAITENAIWANGNHPHNSVSWWAGGSGCGEANGSITVNNICSWEVSNCFGQNLAGDRYLWVYVQ